MSLRALVLGAGGAQGAYEAGAVAALCQNGEFDIVAGTAAGAVNAALAAQGDAAALETLWLSLPGRKLVAPISVQSSFEAFLNAFAEWQTLPPSAQATYAPRLILLWSQIGSPHALLSLLGVLDPAPLETLLRQFASFDKIRNTLIVTANTIAMAPAAFHVFRGDAMPNEPAFQSGAGIETHALTNDSYAGVLLASAALPTAFAPVAVNVNGTPQFFTGGAACAPIGLAVAAGADEITVVRSRPSADSGTGAIPGNLVELGFASQSAMLDAILENDLRAAGLCNAALLNVANAWPAVQSRLKGKRRISLFCVRPQVPFAIAPSDFSDSGKLKAAYDQGFHDGQHPQPY